MTAKLDKLAVELGVAARYLFVTAAALPNFSACSAVSYHGLEHRS